MLVSRACLEATDPFDEEIFPTTYNDTDCRLWAGAKGYRAVRTPFATHESATRGSDETKEKIARFRRDKIDLDQRHNTSEYEDRAFSPLVRAYRPSRMADPARSAAEAEALIATARLAHTAPRHGFGDSGLAKLASDKREVAGIAPSSFECA